MSGIKISQLTEASSPIGFKAAGVQDSETRSFDLTSMAEEVVAASSAASSAVSSAAAAQNAADSAQSTASAAYAAAAEAQTAATEASADAATAQSTATAAQNTANGAQSTAEYALSQANKNGPNTYSGGGAIQSGVKKLLFSTALNPGGTYLVSIACADSYSSLVCIVDKRTNFGGRVTVLNRLGECPTFHSSYDPEGRQVFSVTYAAPSAITYLWTATPLDTSEKTPITPTTEGSFISDMTLVDVTVNSAGASDNGLVTVANLSATPMFAGQVVSVTGGYGAVPSVQLASSTSKSLCSGLMVMAEDCATGSTAKARIHGTLEGVDLSAFSVGAILYVSATNPGQYVQTPPSFPNFSAKVGVVVNASVDGAMYITPDTDPQYQQSGYSTAKYAATMTPGACANNVGLANAGTTNWVAMGTLIIPPDTLLLSTESEMAFICPQPAFEGKFMLAIYRYVEGGNYTRVCYTAIGTMGAASSWYTSLLAHLDAVALEAGGRYYAVFFHNTNGSQLAGLWGTNLNSLPYISWWKNNMGNLAVPPATITPDGEISQHLFLRLRA